MSDPIESPVVLLEDIVKWALRANALFGEDPQYSMEHMAREVTGSEFRALVSPTRKDAESVVKLALGLQLAALMSDLRCISHKYATESEILSLTARFTSVRGEEASWSDLHNRVDDIHSCLNNLLTIEAGDSASLAGQLLTEVRELGSRLAGMHD